MDARVDDKVAVVTGASRGIGAACAEHLARSGANVLVNYSRSEDRAREVVERCLAQVPAPPPVDYGAAPTSPP